MIGLCKQKGFIGHGDSRNSKNQKKALKALKKELKALKERIKESCIKNQLIIQNCLMICCSR